MLEKDLEKQIVNYVVHVKGYCWKLRVDGQNGYPDRTIMLPGGNVFTIEVKRPTGKPSDKQLHFHKILWSIGQRNYIVDNYDDAKAIIDGRGEVCEIPLEIYRRTAFNYLKGDGE